MKRLSLAAPVLGLMIFALLIVGAPQSLFATTAADGGHLEIKRSPTLGDNVMVTVTIDGMPAGVVRRAGIYHHYLAPGRHVLLVSPNALAGRWHTTLDVHPGETYSYVVSFNVDKLVLTRTAKFR